MADYT